jgi:hypothetical protein
MVVDAVLTYQFIKKLTMPFNQWPAYKLGLIDQNGNFLKARKDFTPREKDALGMYDVMIANLKKILAKVPGGGSRLGTVAATLLLLRSNPVHEENQYIAKDLNEKLEQDLIQIINQLQEDGAVAVNSAGSGDVAGIGQPPGSYKGQPGVPKSAMNKYKKANQKGAPKPLSPIMTAMGRRAPMATEETTLEYHTVLNPKIWDGAELKDEVRGKLLQIAEAWRDFAKINPGEIFDIILTGGNANYNYTPNSDLDLHLIIDRNNFGHDEGCSCPSCQLNRMFVDEYMQDKKTLWTLTHPDIRIFGYPVELYAQDVSDKAHMGQGVYSVMQDRWLQEPEYLNLDFEKDPHLQDKVQYYKDVIDSMIDQQADMDSIKVFKDKIKQLRSDSIADGGEFAFGNLVFKELRNAGYLDKLSDYEKSTKDKALSLG